MDQGRLVSRQLASIGPAIVRSTADPLHAGLRIKEGWKNILDDVQKSTDGRPVSVSYGSNYTTRPSKVYYPFLSGNKFEEYR
jgi:hypothetical protein